MSEENIKCFLKHYVKNKPFRLNEERIDLIVKGLNYNEEKYGFRYCPCKLEHNPNNICPCVNHEKDIEENGECHCKLFIK